MYSTENGEYIIPVSSSTIATTRSKCQKTLHDTVYIKQCELPTEKLPVQKDVCCMLYLLHPDRAGKAMRTINESAVLLSNALVEHWHFCNVYTTGETHSEKKSVVATMSSRTVVKPGRIGKLTSGEKECPRTTTNWNQLYLIFRHKTDSARVISKSNMVWRWHL